MADGDPQQGNKILIAIENYCFNAMKARCSWHIVSQGWKRKAPDETRVDGQTNRDRFHTLIRLLQFWMFSWIKPGYCENEEEFYVSKKLLLHFI